MLNGFVFGDVYRFNCQVCDVDLEVCDVEATQRLRFTQISRKISHTDQFHLVTINQTDNKAVKDMRQITFYRINISSVFPKTNYVYELCLDLHSKGNKRHTLKTC